MRARPNRIQAPTRRTTAAFIPANPRAPRPLRTDASTYQVRLSPQPGKFHGLDTSGIRADDLLRYLPYLNDGVRERFSGATVGMGDFDTIMGAQRAESGIEQVPVPRYFSGLENLSGKPWRLVDADGVAFPLTVYGRHFAEHWLVPKLRMRPYLGTAWGAAVTFTRGLGKNYALFNRFSILQLRGRTREEIREEARLFYNHGLLEDQCNILPGKAYGGSEEFVLPVVSREFLWDLVRSDKEGIATIICSGSHRILLQVVFEDIEAFCRKWFAEDEHLEELITGLKNLKNFFIIGAEPVFETRELKLETTGEDVREAPETLTRSISIANGVEYPLPLWFGKLGLGLHVARIMGSYPIEVRTDDIRSDLPMALLGPVTVYNPPPDHRDFIELMGFPTQFTDGMERWWEDATLYDKVLPALYRQRGAFFRAESKKSVAKSPPKDEDLPPGDISLDAPGEAKVD